MRDSYIKEDRSRGIFFDQDWGAMPGVIPVASGGIHVWHMPTLVNIFGDDSCLQFGGETLGHPWGNAAGAAANRVAVEACVEARNAGVEIEKEGKDVLTKAAKPSPELKIAMETWKEIKFEFDTVDKIDVDAILAEIEACHKAHPKNHVRLWVLTTLASLRVPQW